VNLSARPLFPHVVIDQSALRDEQLVREALVRARHQDRLILLPDVALLEMVKAKNWELMFRRNLRLLGEYPAGVVAGRGLGELMREEVKSVVSVEEIVDHEITGDLRRLLQNLKVGAGPTLDEFRANYEAVKREVIDSRLNHMKNKKTLAAYQDSVGSGLKEEQIEALKAGDDALLQGLLASDNTTRFIGNHLSMTQDWPILHSWCLARVDSFSAHFSLCRTATSFLWAGRPELQGMAAKKATNEMLDGEYIVLASKCEGFLTRDKGAKRIYEAVRAAADERWARLVSEAWEDESDSVEG